MPGKDGTGPLGQGVNQGRGVGMGNRGQGRGIGKNQGFGWRQGGGNGAGLCQNRTFGLGNRRFRLGNNACLNPQVDAAGERPASKKSAKFRMSGKLN